MTQAKKAAAKAALEYIRPGMKVGLGTGSTTTYFLEYLGELCRKGLIIQAVASSQASEKKAREVGIPLLPETWIGPLDIVVDGADEVDPQKRLIKGGGGALLREKMLAYHAKQMIVIVDEEKIVPKLGRGKLPLEIIPFGYLATQQAVQSPDIRVDLRLDQKGKPFITDNGNFILDLQINNQLIQIEPLTERLRAIPGVIETGLFVGLASVVIVGNENGSVHRE